MVTESMNLDFMEICAQTRVLKTNFFSEMNLKSLESILIMYVSHYYFYLLINFNLLNQYDNIPVEVSPGCPEPYNEFTPDSIGEQLMKNLALMKFTKPTPVQKYSIPIGLCGGDMMACAQTGSGKTAGFLFPVISMMLKNGALNPPEGRRSKGTYITALVLAPTRELAVQIFEEAQKFCYCTGIRPVVVYGGANIQLQQRELDHGADILVATPGRLVDLIERGRVRLETVRFLVLDEADRM
jgi:ATP-dependent RNA helicase DDX3X